MRVNCRRIRLWGWSLEFERASAKLVGAAKRNMDRSGARRKESFRGAGFGDHQGANFSCACVRRS